MSYLWSDSLSYHAGSVVRTARAAISRTGSLAGCRYMSLASFGEHRAPGLEPARDFGQLDGDPLGALVQPGHGRPGHPVCEARVLRGLEEHVELTLGRQSPARLRHRLPVTTQDPRPLGRWKPHQEGREVVAERPDPHVIPVDEADADALPGDGHEHVRSPQVAVQERVWSPVVIQDRRPAGRFGNQGA